MTQTLEIVELGDPVLRQIAKPVKDCNTPEIQTLIDDMLIQVKKARGVGLAAPQVGVPLRLFIVAPSPKSHRYPNTTLDEGLVVINPTIKSITNKKTSDWEGCLSVPGIRGLVSRKCHIEVSYTNRLNEQVTQEFDSFVARIFLHENDHLDGIIFLDRLANNKDIMTDNYYFDMMEQLEAKEGN
jgi:peptide deformylase